MPNAKYKYSGRTHTGVLVTLYSQLKMTRPQLNKIFAGWFDENTMEEKKDEK